MTKKNCQVCEQEFARASLTLVEGENFTKEKFSLLVCKDCSSIIEGIQTFNDDGKD